VGDVEDARRVAAQLGIPHYVFNLAVEFEEAVVGPYTAGYATGATPNPCVECNRSIKFGVLATRARALGFDALATGHHARTRRMDDGSYRLLRGVDGAKDQSYVLYMLGQSELATTLLPVGELTKAEVREHATRLGLRTAAKPESMDVCFITKGGRRDFLDARVAAAPGIVVDTTGRELGRHDGVAHFTVGQRRGLGVAAGERRYVVALDVATSTVTVGSAADLRRDAIALRDLRWVAAPPEPGTDVLVQTRAHGSPVLGRLTGEHLRLVHPVARVARGQVVAFYADADTLLGGGLAA
jgi:tRNA-specific 2-thiouridylase